MNQKVEYEAKVVLTKKPATEVVLPRLLVRDLKGGSQPKVSVEGAVKASWISDGQYGVKLIFE